MQRQDVTQQKKHGIGIRIDQRRIVTIHRVMLVAALAGLFASMYLFITYVSGKPIACGILQGCEIVRASKWAYTFGLPRPLFGVIFYLGIVFLLAFRAYDPAWHQRTWRLALLVVATIGLVESGFLTLVQWLDIHAFCTWCVTSAIAATVIFILALFDGREPTAKAAIVNELRNTFAIFAAAIVLGAVALHFLLIQSASGVVR